MALNPETVTTLAYLVQVFYEKTFLDNLEKSLVFADYTKKYSLPKGFGPIVYFSRYTRQAADIATLSEGIAPTTSVMLTDERVSATVEQYGNVNIVSDLMLGVHISGPNQFVNQVVEEMSYKAKISIDTLVRNAFCATASATMAYAATQTGTQASATLVGSTHTMGAADIRRIVRTLKKADIPTYDADSYMGIIGPGQSYDLVAETATGGWLDANKYTTPEQIAKGEIGKLFGARITVCNNLSTLSQSGTISVCPFFGKDPVAMVDITAVNRGDKKMEYIDLFIKEPGTAGSADPLNQIGTVGYKFSCVAKRLNDLSVVLLLAGETP